METALPEKMLQVDSDDVVEVRLLWADWFEPLGANPDGAMATPFAAPPLRVALVNHATVQRATILSIAGARVGETYEVRVELVPLRGAAVSVSFAVAGPRATATVTPEAPAPWWQRNQGKKKR